MSKTNRKKGITNHSIRRARQRTGITSNQLVKISNRAKVDGLSRDNTKGELYSLLSRFQRKNSVAKFYANVIYVFIGDSLITVMNVDPSYEKNLLDYVTVPVYVNYLKSRFKYKTNKTELFNAATKQMTQKLRYDIELYLKQFDDAFKYKSFNLSYNEVNIEQRKKTENDEQIVATIKRYLSGKYSIKAKFISTNGKEIFEDVKASFANTPPEVQKFDSFIENLRIKENYSNIKNIIETIKCNSLLSRGDEAYLKYLVSQLNIGTEKEIKQSRKAYNTFLTSLKNSFRTHESILPSVQYLAKYLNDDNEEVILIGYMVDRTTIVTHDGILFNNITSMRPLAKKDEKIKE